MSVTPEQIRAARALLGWRQTDLAIKARFFRDVDETTKTKMTEEELADKGPVFRFETGRTRSIEILDAMCNALAAEGIVFLPSGGVDIVKKRDVRILRGQEGFWSFYDDVYETVKATGGEILVSSAVEGLYWKWLGEKREPHRKRMETIEFTQKIIIREGTEHTRSYSTTHFRELPKEQFADIPFYVYGEKLAIIHFEEDDVQVFVLEEAAIAEAYRKMFRTIWNICKKPSAEAIKED